MARTLIMLLVLLAMPARVQTLTALEENVVALSSYCAGALTVIISDPSTIDHEEMLTRQRHFMAWALLRAGGNAEAARLAHQMSHKGQAELAAADKRDYVRQEVICTLQAGNRLKPGGAPSDASYDKVFECLSREDRVLGLWFACRAHPLP